MAAVVLLALLLLWPASRLRLLTDLPALLPAGAPAAQDYRVFLRHFGGFERAFVLLMGPQGQDSRELLLPAAEALAQDLAASPEVADVRSGVRQEEQDFFLRQAVRRAPLLIDDGNWSVLEDALKPERLAARAAELKAQIHSPAGGPTMRLNVHDPLGLWRELDDLMAAETGLPVDPVTSTFLSNDGSVALLVLTPTAGEIDAEGGRRLQAELDRAFAALRETYPTVRTAALGGPLYAAHDERLIRQDLEGTLAGSAIACSAILFLAFGGPAIPLITLVCVLVALVMAAAALALGLGSVTGVALGFAAVLVGLGVDYGIHGGTRYRQRRLAGDTAAAALDSTLTHAGPAIATAALTTACAFAALGAAHFRPLREMGVVVAVGIVAMLPAFGLLGASLVSWTDGGSVRGGWFWRFMDRGANACVDLARARPKTVVAAALALTLLTLPGVLGLRLNPDLRALRPENSRWQEAERLLTEQLGVGLGTATVAIPGIDLDQALARAEAATLRLRQAGDGVSVVSPTDFWPTAESRHQRLQRLRELPLAAAADILRAELVSQNVNPRAFASGLQAMEELGAGRDLPRPGSDQWPRALRELITEDADGTVWIALRVRFSAAQEAQAGFSDALVADLKAISPGVAPASAGRLGAEMKRLADRDFQALTWVALILVAVVVGVSFRGRLWASLLALTPVALGSFWLLGLWSATGRSLDLLSLSVLPILLGIGIDDGLHGVHGALETGRRTVRGLGDSVRSAGLAMTLTTVTTSAGFAGLASSSIPGLSSGGLLVAAGVWLCLLTTLMLLPAIGELLDRRAQVRGSG